MVQVSRINGEMPDVLLTAKAKHAIGVRDRYFERVLTFFRGKPGSRLIMVSVEEADWIDFLSLVNWDLMINLRRIVIITAPPKKSYIPPTQPEQ